jgi:hypothetical protein
MKYLGPGCSKCGASVTHTSVELDILGHMAVSDIEIQCFRLIKDPDALRRMLICHEFTLDKDQDVWFKEACP